MLFVIGDSHALYCFAGVENARLYWTGPRSMHRVGRDGVRRQLPLFCNPRQVDHVVFIFGEVDCRALVERVAAEKHRPLQVILADLAKRYVGAVSEFARRRGVACAICTVIRPPRGSPDNQIPIRESLNRLLRQEALLHSISVVDVEGAVAGTGGFMRDGWELDTIHINPRENRPIIDAMNAAMGTRYGHSPITDNVMHYAHISKFRRIRKIFTDPLRLFLKALRRTVHSTIGEPGRSD